MARSIAREHLQAISLAPRGSPASVIRNDIAPKIHASHVMFVGKTLIEKDHPVCKEYEWPIGWAQVRFFPLPGVHGETIDLDRLCFTSISGGPR